jgi:hypothetical protein
MRAAATLRYRGARCQDIRRLPTGRTVTFTVHVVPAAGGPLTLTARATAIGRAGAMRDRAQARISASACLTQLARAAC